MATEAQKLARWRYLDQLLSLGEFISLGQIIKKYHENPELRVRDLRSPGEDISYLYMPSLRKDLDIFKKTLKSNGLEGMLEAEQGKGDKRTIMYRYKERGFSLMPYMEKGMTRGEYHTLLRALEKIKPLLSVTAYDELCFALLSRAQAENGKLVSVIYEDNMRLKGRSWLPLIYRAITKKKRLFIKYRKFNGEARDYHLHPYLLKQYNERWYIFGYREEKDDPRAIVPIDRIEKIVELEKFDRPAPPDYPGYFAERVGVSHRKDETLHRIVIAVRNLDAWGRAITKPLPTQTVLKEFDKEKSYGEIELNLYPNIEFFTKILSWGENIEILSDEEVRAEFVRIIGNIAGNYGL